MIHTHNYSCMPMTLGIMNKYSIDYKEYLQRYPTKPNSWVDNWLTRHNRSECEKVLLGKHTASTERYTISIVELEIVRLIEDLGVIFDSHLKLRLLISGKLIKDFSNLGIIRRNFSFLITIVSNFV